MNPESKKAIELLAYWSDQNECECDSKHPIGGCLKCDLESVSRIIMKTYIETWRELIAKEMNNHGESWEDTVDSTLTDEQLDKEFDSGLGEPEGEPFTVWTANRVYFPITRDGAEWCGSVSRNPDGHATPHLGSY